MNGFFFFFFFLCGDFFLCFFFFASLFRFTCVLTQFLLVFAFSCAGIASINCNADYTFATRYRYLFFGLVLAVALSL